MGAYFAWDIFVEKQALTSQFVVEGLLGGPYIHFWFFYMLIGLYLVTPLVRVFVAHASRHLMRYLFVLWLAGVSVVPLLNLLVAHNLSGNVFLVTVYWVFRCLGFISAKYRVKEGSWALFLAGLCFTALGSIG
jgi:surface polysaccharide O-acyltransferase-like enzyme